MNFFVNLKPQSESKIVSLITLNENLIYLLHIYLFHYSFHWSKIFLFLMLINYLRRKKKSNKDEKFLNVKKPFYYNI